MDKLRTRDIENFLGIYSPYYIKDMKVDEEADVFTIQLDEISNKNKSLSSRFKSTIRPNTYRWKHVKFGRFNTIIEFKSTEANLKRTTKLICPAFLGSIEKNHTKQFEEVILFAHGKKLDADTISTLTGLDIEGIKKLILDTENTQITATTSSLLPLETDPIWIKIIKREIAFKTQLTPLKMLLHKLELSEINDSDDYTLQESVATLRAFFVKNKANLKSEYNQIGAKKEQQVDPMNKPVSRTKSSTKLTPAHPVWDNILTEKFSLMSSNLAFNLYISRLKSLYKQDLSSSEKRDIVIELMKYLKKNLASLRHELISIKKIAESIDSEPENNVIPNKDDSVWLDILAENIEFSSKKLNLNLLLVKLKSQLSKGFEKESCNELQQFFIDNQRSLAEEISLLTSSKAEATS